MRRTHQQNLRHKLLCLAWLAWGVAWSAGARAQIIQGEEFVLDFTHPDTLKGRVETFPEALKFSEKGLGYDAEANRLLNRTRFQTTEPIALGFAWTPTSAVTIHASLNTDFEYIGAYSLGRLYARYSPDTTHWSSWQNIMSDKRADKSALTHTYQGQLIVPDVERLPYFDLLEQFYKAQPEQTGDEEAAVRWLVKKDARYFEKTLPFIGYIQVLFETPLEGGRHLKSLQCNLIWSLPGLHRASRRERDAQKNNTSLPWSYRAAPARTKRAPRQS